MTKFVRYYLSALLFCALSLGLCPAKEQGMKGLNINKAWRRASVDTEKDFSSWMFTRQKPMHILAFVPWAQATSGDKKRAREIMVELMSTQADPNDPRIWRENTDSMVVRSAKIITADKEKMVSVFVCFWDKKAVRTMGFRFKGSNPDVWPAVCENFLQGWLHFGAKLSVNKALEAAIKFQAAVAADNPDALVGLCVPGVIAKLNACNKVLFSKLPSKGWKTLVEQSLVIPAGLSGRFQKIFYYHPWSDVALATWWGKDPVYGKAKLSDAVLLDGEFFRTKKLEGATGVLPRWRQLDYPPLAVCSVSGKMVKAVQFKSDDRLRCLQEDENLSRQQLGVAGLKFLSYFLNLSEFYQDAKTGQNVLWLLEHLAAKDRSLLKQCKDDELTQAIQILLNSESAYIESLRPRAYFKTSDGGVMVILSGRSVSSFIVLNYVSDSKKLPAKILMLNFDNAVARIRKEK